MGLHSSNYLTHDVMTTGVNVIIDIDDVSDIVINMCLMTRSKLSDILNCINNYSIELNMCVCVLSLTLSLTIALYDCCIVLLIYDEHSISLLVVGVQHVIDTSDDVLKHVTWATRIARIRGRVIF